MKSAFGVEHEFSKSWKKLAPKLEKVTRRLPKDTDTFQDRMKVNYTQMRNTAGHQAQSTNDTMKYIAANKGTKWEANPNMADYTKDKGKSYKRGAAASVKGYSNNVKRNRTLP